MRRWTTIVALSFAALLWSGLAGAQTAQDDDDRGDDGRHRERFALGIGAGFVEPSGDVENYFMASLRIRTSGRGSHDGSDNGSRGRDPRGEGMTGYIEPEFGYWEASGDNGSGSDTLLGVNLIGVVPLGSVDTFFGVGVGAHFIDAALLEDDPSLDGSDTKLGGNAQFGLDLYITDSLSAFGAGRFDLVQGAKDSVQSKVYLGLRAHF
jgi:hypothetical protein